MLHITILAACWLTLGQRGPVGLSPISAYVVAADKCSGQAVLLFPSLGVEDVKGLCLVDCKIG